jgi:RNA polymerase sigma factor (sigma-70 family)
MDKWLDEATDIAAQVARQVHKKYQPYFDVSDLRQELMVWCIKREDKVKMWLDPTKDKEERERGVRYLGKTLSRHADRYCRRRKAQSLGYELRDEVYYTPAILSEVLPYVWGEIAEAKDTSKPKVSGGGNPAEGGNYIVSVIDIKKGLEKIDVQDRMVLELRFFESLTLSQIATTLQVSDSTADRKVRGALRRLCYKLGGDNPWERYSRGD